VEGGVTKKAIWNTPPVIPDKVRRRTATKVGPLAGLKTLNAREWKFVQEYVSNDGNMTLKEAAIRAGYKAHSASVTAWKLTNPDICPHVVAAIQAYRAELASKYNTTYERHMKDLQTIRDAALQAGAYSAAVQAEYRRGQALGTIYVERKEIRHGTIDQMSKEEVQKKLDELKKLYGGPPGRLIEATPDEIASSNAKEADPSFDPGVEDPPPDIFEKIDPSPLSDET
jgi:phage terminase small subunit